MPCGFKRKGRHWILDSDSIVKMVNLQKSNFGNKFYVNYGYIIKALPLGNLKMHFYKRLGSKNISEGNRISQIFDLESEMPEDRRIAEINHLLLERLIREIKAIDSENDVRDELMRSSSASQIPVVVRNYFKLA